MQHVNRALEFYRVHGPVSVAAVVGDDFQDTRPFALPRFRFRVLAAKLLDAKRRPVFVLHALGKLHEVVLR